MLHRNGYSIVEMVTFSMLWKESPVSVLCVSEKIKEIVAAMTYTRKRTNLFPGRSTINKLKV